MLDIISNKVDIFPNSIKNSIMTHIFGFFTDGNCTFLDIATSVGLEVDYEGLQSWDLNVGGC